MKNTSYLKLKSKIFLYFTLLFISFNSLGQINVKMKVTFNNGKIDTGLYSIQRRTFIAGIPKTRVVSKKTRQKYKLNKIKNIIMYSGNDSIYFEVIKTKKYIKSKKAKNKLVQIGYVGNKIELFYASEFIYQGGSVGSINVSSYYETYVRRKNENIAYNMGYIYGAAQRGIKKRVREYFIDCPLLIEKVNNNEIPKKETLKIAKFYENNCNF